ncbi:hypothetical protein CHARACLAT_030406 [Characodon lateralis]|uniref:Uncharacterized protein n=1 Tax=Characodon lateralis TaxID=208331 RepID=A0ABU7EH09_9TELE|nr:hypothetical protein [Characodon lateralis]
MHHMNCDVFSEFKMHELFTPEPATVPFTERLNQTKQAMHSLFIPSNLHYTATNMFIVKRNGNYISFQHFNVLNNRCKNFTETIPFRILCIKQGPEVYVSRKRIPFWREVS